MILCYVGGVGLGVGGGLSLPGTRRSAIGQLFIFLVPSNSPSLKQRIPVSCLLVKSH